MTAEACALGACRLTLELWTQDGSCLTRQGAPDCLTGTRTHAGDFAGHVDTTPGVSGLRTVSNT
eukprot:7006024-Prymnesium_polylepis.1